MDEEAKTHATTISHTSTTRGTITTTTTTITTIYKHRHNTDTHHLIMSNQQSQLLNEAIDLYLGCKYQEAKHIIEELFHANNPSFAVHFHYACICNKLQIFDLATKHLDLALTMNSDPNAYKSMVCHLIELNPSHSYYRDKHKQHAHAHREDMTSIIHRLHRDSPDEYNTNLISGLLLYEMNQYASSEECFKQCLHLHALSDEPHAYYGMLLMDMKRYNAADECLSKAITLSKQNTNKHGVWHLKYAQLLHAMKRYQECEAQHKETLAMEPNNAEYNEHYAAFLMIAGRFKESSTYFLRAHQAQNEKKEYRIMHEFAQSMSNVQSARDVDKKFSRLQKECSGSLSEGMARMKKEVVERVKENDKKYQMVKKYYKLKQYDKCHHMLRQLMDGNPHHFDYHFLNAKVLESGRIASNWRDFAAIRAAVASYKCALSVNPLHGGCRFNFGKLLIKLRKFESACTQFKAAIESNPKHCAYNMIYAIVLMYDPMNSDDAAELLDEELVDEDDEEYVNPMVDYNESAVYFKKCLSLHPKNAECNYKYGLLLMKMAKNEEALGFIRKANKLKNDKEKRYKLRYNKLKNLIKKGAEDSFVMEKRSGNISRKYSEIMIDDEVEAEEEEEEEEEKPAVTAKKKKKKKKRVTYGEYKELIALRQYKKARGVMKELVALDPSNSAFAHEYGLLLRRDKKKMSEAEKYFGIAMSLKPESVEYKSSYGCLLFDNERYKESESYLKYCVVSSPSNAFYNHMYALLLQRQHKFHESFEYHQKAIQLDYLNEKYKATYNALIAWYDQFPRQEKERMKRMYLEAESHAKHMEFSIAEPTFKKLVDKNPYNLVYVFRYAYVLQRLKKYDLAEKYYRMCLNIEGDHNICHGDYALLLSKLKRYKEADIHYRKCLYTDPQNWICRKNYAVSLEIRQRYKEAAKYFREALQINPNDRETNQRYEKLLDRIPKLKLKKRRGRKKKRNQVEELSKAMRMIQKNDLKSAIQILKPLSKHRLEYARCLRDTNMLDDAVQVYKSIATHESFYELGNIYENRLKDLAKASHCYRQAFELQCNNDLYRQSCQNCVKNLQLLEFGRNFSSGERKRMTMIFDEANEYIKCKKYKEAKKRLEEILLMNPDYFLYNAKYALVLHRLKMYKLAEKYFKKAIATDPTNSISRGVYGGMLFQLKRYSDAEHELKVCLAINPNNWICHQDYARLLEYKNDFKNAAFHSKKAFEINPSDHESYQRYEYLLTKMNCDSESIQSSPRSNYSRSTYIPVHTDDTQTSYEYDYSDEDERDLEYYEGAIQSGECSPECLFEYAVLLESLNKTKEALKYFKQLCAMECAVPEYHNRYGLLLRAEGKYESANGAFQRGISLAPHRVDLVANYAYSLFLNERYKEAEVVIQQCLDKDGENGFVNHVYALLLRRTNRFAEAFQYHHKAIELNPHNAEFKQRYDEFLEYSNRFSHDEKQKMKRKFDRAQMMIKSKHFDKARNLLKQLSAVNPYNIVYVFKYAFVLHRLKQYKEAEKYYKLALNVEGDHSICHFDYGLMLSKLRRLEEAQYHYRRCLHMNPSDWICHINYARLLEKFGNLKDAAYHLEKALEINPNDAEAHQCYSGVVKKLKQQKHWTKKTEAAKKSPWRRVTQASANKLNILQQKDAAKHAIAKGNYAKAKQIYEELRITSTNATEYAQILEHLHLYRDAVKYYGNKLHDICAQYMSQKDYESANNLLQCVDTKDFELVCLHAHTLKQLNQFNEAEQQYKEALKLKPNQPICYYNLGCICEARHRNAEATMYLEKAAALDKENEVYRSKYNQSVRKLQQQQRHYYLGTNYNYTAATQPIQAAAAQPVLQDDQIQIQDELNYNSYLFAAADNLSDISEEKTIDTTHQSYRQKQRLKEFTLFLQHKVGFNSKHFEEYLRRFVDKGLADLRMLPYLDEVTLSNMGMSPPHQKLLLNKIEHFKKQMQIFSNLFADKHYYNVFADAGICCVDSFCSNFKNNKNQFELMHILDNNTSIVDLLWTQINKLNK
eukprot:297804_1